MRALYVLVGRPECDEWKGGRENSAQRTDLVSLECQSLQGRVGSKKWDGVLKGPSQMPLYIAIHFIFSALLGFCIQCMTDEGALIWERVSWVEGDGFALP